MSKETFKEFVRIHPELAGHVAKGEATWQQYYELYDMYGENHSVWKKHFTVEESAPLKVPSKDTTVQELLNMVKSVDLETVQRGINGVQKAIGLIQDLGLGSLKNASKTPSYEPRPMHKYYED